MILHQTTRRWKDLVWAPVDCNLEEKWIGGDCVSGGGVLPKDKSIRYCSKSVNLSECPNFIAELFQRMQEQMMKQLEEMVKEFHEYYEKIDEQLVEFVTGQARRLDGLLKH